MAELEKKVKTKKCRGTCGEELTMEHFYSKGAVCKTCSSAVRKDEDNEKLNGNKYCPSCKTTKSRDQFSIEKGRVDGCATKCRECAIKEAEKGRAKNKEANKDGPAKVITHKKCANLECKIQDAQPIENFAKDSNSASGYQSRCKVCRTVPEYDYTKNTTDMTKICNNKNCSSGGKPQLLSAYSKSKTGTLGYGNECNACRSAKRKATDNKKPEEGMKECSTCKEKKSISEFHADKTAGDGMYSECKTCRIKIYNKSRSTLNGFLTKLYSDLRGNAKKRDINVNIDLDDIKNLYEKQNGLCELSGIEMTHITSERTEDQKTHNYNFYNASVDRMDPLKQYDIDNIQLVCAIVNRMKYTYNVVDYKQMCNTVMSYNNQKVAANKIEISKHDNKQFTAFMSKLFAQLMSNAEKRKLTVKINVIDIRNMFINQGGRCKLSGKLMSYDKDKSSLTNFSVDRIDSDKDYEIDNVQLVQQIINICKNDYSNKDFIDICTRVASKKDIVILEKN